MADDDILKGEDSKPPRAVGRWLIAFGIFAVLAAGTILYMFTTRFGQMATPGAAPVQGNGTSP